MKKVIVSVFIFISLFMTVTSKAQIQNQTIDEDIEIPETMIWSIDSLLNDWKTQKYLDLQKDCQTAKDNP